MEARSSVMLWYELQREEVPVTVEIQVSKKCLLQSPAYWGAAVTLPTKA